jgi:hypothetical protein
MREVLNNIGMFMFGGIAVFWFLSKKFEFVDHPKSTDDESEEEVKDDEELEEVDDDFETDESDDDHYYYVKLPTFQKPVVIAVEEKLAMDHLVEIKGAVYVVTQILHRIDKHTVYILKDYKPTL